MLSHGLATGETIEYDPSGNTPISGLQVTYVDPDDITGTVLRRVYDVVVVDDDHLSLGSVFKGSDITANRETIFFSGGHNFLRGDAVVYHKPSGSTQVAGLTPGAVYSVDVVDEKTIRLVTSLAQLTNPSAHRFSFTPGDISGGNMGRVGVIRDSPFVDRKDSSCDA